MSWLSGLIGGKHKLRVAPKIERCFWSSRLVKPGMKTTLHVQTTGVKNNTKVTVELTALSPLPAVKPKKAKLEGKIKKGLCTIEWQADLEGLPEDEKSPMTLIGFIVSISQHELKNSGMNLIGVAEYGAIVRSVTKTFCPCIETLDIEFSVEDPFDFVRSGAIRIYGNQVGGKSYPEEDAIVYQRLLTPEEITTGTHTAQWEGLCNAEAGPFKSEGDDRIYVNPLHSPYVVDVQLLDRAIEDIAKWPSDDALPSIPHPKEYDGTSLTAVGDSAALTAAGKVPAHSAFEIVIGGVELELGGFVPDEAEVPDDDSVYQLRLNQLGYFCGPVDGVVGKLSKKGIHQFKRRHWEVDDVGMPDYDKPLGGEDTAAVPDTLDAKTKKAIDEADEARAWMRLYDDKDKVLEDKFGEPVINRLPKPDERARLILDGTVFYQTGPEFQDQDKKFNKERDWIPRPWIPVEAKPLLKDKNGNDASAARSKFGCLGMRVLWRVVDPVEDHKGLGFPTGTFDKALHTTYSVTEAGKDIADIATEKGFADADPLLNDPLNAAIKTKLDGGNALEVGDSIKIPPFPNFAKYKAHKEGLPETYLNAVIADLSGVTADDWVADNAPTTTGGGGEPNYGSRTEDESRRGSDYLRHGDKLYKLAPWTPTEVDDTRAGSGKCIATTVLKTGPKRGKTGAYFVPSHMGGDNYRIEVWVDLEKNGDGSDLDNTKWLESRYEKGSPLGKTGLINAWRRIEVSEFQYIRSRTVEPTTLRQIDWDRMIEIYQQAHIELVVPEDRGGSELTEEKYKEIAAEAYGAQPDTITINRDRLFPELVPTLTDAQKNSHPLRIPAQGARSPRNYVEKLNEAAGTFREKFAAVAGKKLRRENRMGAVVVDFRRGFDYVPIKKKPPSGPAYPLLEATVRKMLERGFCSSGEPRGVLMLDQRDGDDAAYVWAHELAHALFLYHWRTPGDAGMQQETPKEHDHGDDYCVMNYPESPMEDGKIDPDFCGKCLLKLRGWDVYWLAENAP